MTKPIFTVPHRVEPGSSIKLYAHIHQPFLHLMAGLYPKLAPYTGASKGFSAFTADGQFIGSFGGKTLASIRKNPTFNDDGAQTFLRAVLGGLHAAGETTCRNVCEQDNYGTLRLWQRMGLGVEIDARSKAASAALTPDTAATLAHLIEAARVPYADHRAYAAKVLRSIPADRLATLIPSEKDMGSTYHSTVDVTLL